jgi:hypothetical protein
VIFGRGELSGVIYGELRDATEPLSSRDIAQAIVAMRGEDARDRRYISDLTKRVSKAPKAMKAEGSVKSLVDRKGNVRWQRVIRPDPTSLR